MRAGDTMTKIRRLPGSPVQSWPARPARSASPVAMAVLAVLLAAAPGRQAAAQVPDARDPVTFDNDALGEEWAMIGSHQEVRRKASTKFVPSLASRENRDVVDLLMETAYADRDYLEAFQWATEFLALFGADGEAARALYIKGVCAFQLRLLGTSREALSSLLSNYPEFPERGSAYFWRAMVEVDAGNPDAAEADLAAMMGDNAAAGSREDALFGWALSLERRGRFDQATLYLDSLMSEFPGGRLSTDAKLRTASMAMRQDKAREAWTVLGDAAPSTPAQREEFDLLNGEASFRLGNYTAAESSFTSLLESNSGSQFAPQAELGLAWSYIRQGEYAQAREHLDSLANRDDSIGVAALYQSAVLAMLAGDEFTALAKFDTLTVRSPYDRFAERSYIQIGMIHYRNRRYRDAKKSFSYAARLFPGGERAPLAYRMMGESCLAINDFGNAQYGFAKARKLGGSAALVSAAMYREGIAMYHLGRFRSSEDILEKFLASYPSSPDVPDALLWRAEALYQDGRFDEAERAFASAVAKLPDEARKSTAAYGAAWSLFEQQKFSSAAAGFEAFAKKRPDDPRSPEADLRRADCYFFLGQYDRSSDLYQALTASGKGGRQVEYAAFQLGMSYVQRGDADRGVTHLRDFLKKYPESIYCEVVQFNIAWTYFSREDYKTALTEFGAFRASYPESQLMPRVYFNTGDSWYNLKEYDSSRVYYQRVLTEFPSSALVPDAMSGLQYTYQAEGKPAGAIAEIDKFIESAPEGGSREDLIMRKGDILFSQGDYGGAALEYQSLLKLNPPRELRAKALYQLGRTYQLEGNEQQAVSYYEEVLKSDDSTETSQNVRLMAGVSYNKIGEHRKAVDVLRPFAGKYPQSPLLTEANYQLGVALMNLPDKPGARKQFQDVIDKHPDDIFADRSRLQLAQMHAGAKEYKAAQDTLDRIVARRNDDVAAEALLQIGENYLSLKKPADALQAFKDVYEQYGEFPVFVERARLGAGESCEKLRDTKQAADLYRMVVDNPVDPAMKKEAEDRLRRLKE
jgi:tetratricopeptide (TPR) repeat protein